MKNIVFLFAAFCCIYVAVAEVGKTCENSDDCEEGECCVHIHKFTAARCKKYRVQDEFCFPVFDSHIEDGKYKFMCPCIEGLECKSEKIEEGDGITTYINAKCVQ